MVSIPRHIHLIYFNENPVIPEDYAVYLNTIRSFHPGWNINIYNAYEARSIVEANMPDLLHIYDGYELEVQRLDVFKFVVIYVFGGFFMDFDMLCFKSLDDICGHQLILGEEVVLTREECIAKDIQHAQRIANFMFGSVQRHPFWLDVLTGITEKALTKILNENDVLESTGPALLTNVYHRVKQHYKDITMLLNSNRKCLKACEKISCHFGEYAAHLHQGRWRWQTTQTGCLPLKGFKN